MHYVIPVYRTSNEMERTLRVVDATVLSLWRMYICILYIYIYYLTGVSIILSSYYSEHYTAILVLVL